MKKELLKVRAMLEKRFSNLEGQKLSASLTAEQLQAVDAAMLECKTVIDDLAASETAATNEEIVASCIKAMEAIAASSDITVENNKKEMQAIAAKLEAKISKSAPSTMKVKASLSLKTLSGSKANAEGFKPFHAGVDVTDWTPEAEIENVEIFHPLLGLAKGFDISSTTKNSIKVRKMELGSGAAAVVLNHGIKPKLEYVGSENIVHVGTYAGVVEGIADEDLEDNATLEAEIQQEALVALAISENVAAATLLDGAAQSFANAAFGTMAKPDFKTAVSAIIDQVRQALGVRQSNIVLAMNSSQWAKLKDLRNDNGTPIDVTSVIGDVVQIVDNSLTSDSFICWAQKFAKIRIYKGATPDWYKGVKVTTVEGNITAVTSEWRTDESSLRVRQREVLYVTDDTTVVKGTLSGVVTALTTEQP